MIIGNKESNMLKKNYKIGILTSGFSRGSNIKAIYSIFQKNKYPVEIAFIMITDNEAPIKYFCDQENIPVVLYEKSKGKINDFLILLSKTSPVDCFILSGFMRKLNQDFLNSIQKPVLNIHPALLPLYGGKGMYGLKVHQAVFDSGDKESGATVHYVNENYDEGNIVLQKSVDISTCQNPEEIAQKVLSVEHSIYGQAIWMVLNK